MTQQAAAQGATLHGRLDEPDKSPDGNFRIGLFLSGWMDPGAPNTREYVDQALGRISLAEQCGFSSVWVGQHILGDPWPVLDTSVWLGRIAGETETMDIGGVYVLPLTHPVQLAESLISLDNISGGRLRVCAALGWAPREFAALGVPKSQRRTRFEECLEILRLLWENDEQVSFSGRHFQLDEVRMVSRPQREGGIPVWLGASSEVAVSRAARIGDGWLGSSHTPLADLAKLASTYEEACRTTGRVPSRRPLLRHCMVAETDELAQQRFTEAFQAYYRALGDWGIFREVVGDAHSVERSDLALPPGRAIVGSPETVIAQIKEYQDLGFNEIITQTGLPGTPEDYVRESIELLGEVVLPAVRGLHPLVRA
jgi:alkanesulfonate monooxygenase SsuD/methylene tetrahydromethanopterin reductase-like flavin-dependent oxidoreductase (luciferase family)